MQLKYNITRKGWYKKYKMSFSKGTEIYSGAMLMPVEKKYIQALRNEG